MSKLKIGSDKRPDVHPKEEDDDKRPTAGKENRPFSTATTGKHSHLLRQGTWSSVKSLTRRKLTRSHDHETATAGRQPSVTQPEFWDSSEPQAS